MPTVKEAKSRLKGIRGHVAVTIWQREDVIRTGKEMGVLLSDRSADEIHDDIDRHHDAELGISWTTIRCAIESWQERHPHYRRYNRAEED